MNKLKGAEIVGSGNMQGTGDCKIFAACKTKNRIANHIRSVRSRDLPTPTSQFEAKITAMMDSTGAVSLRQLQQTPVLKYSYLVKFIQAKKSEFIVRMWHNEDARFSALTVLRLKLMDYFQEELPATSNF